MQTNPYDTYLESQVLAASPLELVEMLYRGAIDSVRTARMRLAAGDIAGRGQAVTRAMNLMGELVQSLDLDNGGKLASDLRELYDYVLRRLQTGNYEQQDRPLAEAETLLGTLLEGWQAAAAVQRAESGAGGEGRLEPDEAGSTVSLSF